MLVYFIYGYGNSSASVRYRILNSDSTVYKNWTTVGVSEVSSNTGTYVVDIPSTDLDNRVVESNIVGTDKSTYEPFTLPVYPGIENLTSTGYIIVGQGRGPVIYTDLVTNNNRPVQKCIVKAYKRTDGITDWSEIKGMDETNINGEFTLYLDESEHLLSFEKNGQQIGTRQIMVEAPVAPPAYKVFPDDPENEPNMVLYVDMADPTVNAFGGIYNEGLGYVCQSVKSGDHIVSTGGPIFFSKDGNMVGFPFEYGVFYRIATEHRTLHNSGHGYDEWESGLSLPTNFIIGEQYNYPIYPFIFSDYCAAMVPGDYYQYSSVIVCQELNRLYSMDKQTLLDSFDTENGTLTVNGLEFSIDIDDEDALLKKIYIEKIDRPKLSIYGRKYGDAWNATTSPIVATTVDHVVFNAVEAQSQEEAYHVISLPEEFEPDGTKTRKQIHFIMDNLEDAYYSMVRVLFSSDGSTFDFYIANETTKVARADGYSFESGQDVSILGLYRYDFDNNIWIPMSGDLDAVIVSNYISSE